MNSTLGERVAQRDEVAFIGRRAQLQRLEALLVDDPSASIAFVHAPGGTGKSTLLREFARRAGRRGWHPFWVEGRELPPAPDALEDALAGARADARPLIVLDSYERMEAVGTYLRRALLPTLPATTIVLIASRNAPAGVWFSEGWEKVVMELELERLSDAESAELLRAHGLRDQAAISDAMRWARGSPLALSLAAEGREAEAPAAPLEATGEAAALRTMISRLTEAELDPAHADALNVAAVARVTTPELLRDCLRSVDHRTAFHWLETRSFVEPLGDGIALYDLVRRVLRENLRRNDRERERELRRRIADHLYERARTGERLLTVDLAHLSESPALRWGYAWEDSSRFRIDDVRDGDAKTIGGILERTRYAEWWDGTRRFFEEAPEHVAVIRDASERLCGYSVAVTPHGAPAFCPDDPVLGPRLEHAARQAPDGDAVLWRDSIDLTRDPASPVIPMLGMAGILRSALENPRFAYLVIDPRLSGALEFSAALEGRHLPELDARLGTVEIECHLVDYGPGGLLGAQRDVVYRELGLPPPPLDGAKGGADFAIVRQALRSLNVPQTLAASPLASGDSASARAESVRELLHEAAGQAFGNSENEPPAPRAGTRLPRPGTEPRARRRRAPPQPLGLLPSPAHGHRPRGRPHRPARPVTVSHVPGRDPSRRGPRCNPATRRPHPVRPWRVPVTIGAQSHGRPPPDVQARLVPAAA